jgi:2-phosphosulfolactate phosphatase
MNSVEVVFSPALLQYYTVENKIVVVIDILRATSSICVAFQHGALRILPVETVNECSAFRNQDFLCAAERDGQVVEGFDIGNSPFSYMGDHINGKSIVLTTTNGTIAIHMARNAYQVVIGSFLNLSYLCNWLRNQNRDVILLCAGWKNKFNLEDTLFAGAVVAALRNDFNINCDSAIVAEDLYALAAADLYKYVQKSSHSHRFEDLGIKEDVAYCMQTDIMEVIPVLEGDYLVKLKAKIPA